MEKKKGMQMLVIAALSFTILFMSVGFAGYVTNLDINGTATIKASKWSVHFDKTKYTENTGSVEAKAHSVEDLTATYTVTLTKPGDYYSVSLDIVNDGTFDAVLNSINMTALSDAQKKYLKYELMYDGSTYTADASSLSSALDAKTRKTVTVKITYIQPDLSTDLPSEDIDVTLSATLGYNQKTSTSS